MNEESFFWFGGLCGVLVGAGIALKIALHVLVPQAYEEVHKGIVKCVTNPDSTVYCYRTDSNKGE